MATSKPRRRRFDRETLLQRGTLVGVLALCTVTLTAVFVGIVGLASGQTTALVARLPLYVLASAVVFLGTLLALDHTHRHGRTVLGQAVGIAIASFVAISLGVEGVVYALTHPEAVVASHLFVYLLSAAIIASGLGYWVVENRRDLRDIVTASR